MSDVEKLFNDEKLLASQTQVCMLLAIEGQRWQERLLTKFSNSIKSDNTLNKTSKKNDQFADPAEAKPGPDKLKVVRFKDLQKVDFSTLTESQKTFLQKNGVPTSDEDLFEGASSAVFKPAIAKMDSTGGALLIASNSDSNGDTGTVFFSIYDLDKLSEIPLKGISEEINGKNSSYVSFAIRGDSLVGVFKIEAEQIGNDQDGLVSCLNSGTQFDLRREHLTSRSSTTINLGTDCPAFKKNPQKSVEIYDYNNEQNEIFVKRLFEKLANRLS